MCTRPKVGRMATWSLAIGAVFASLGGCATGLPHAPGGSALGYIDYAGTPVQEFTAFQIRWLASREPKSIGGVVRRQYGVLAAGLDTCPDLRFAYRIGVTSTAYTVSHLDYVRVDHNRCPIAAIRPIDLKKMNQDRAAAKLAG